MSKLQTLKEEHTMRQAIKKKPFSGVDWSHSTSRPGANDHLKYGSLQADGSIKPHRAPVHGCVGVLNDMTPHDRGVK